MNDTTKLHTITIQIAVSIPFGFSPKNSKDFHICFLECVGGCAAVRYFIDIHHNQNCSFCHGNEFYAALHLRANLLHFSEVNHMKNS